MKKKLARLSASNNQDRGGQPIQMSQISSEGLDELPDSLLIHILSFLTTKEAAVTCVLLKRWRFLWCNVPSLELWESLNQNEDPLKPHRFVALEKTRRFVAWVNWTLAVRTTNSVDKFSLRIQYHRSYDSDIGNWIRYAITNRVNNLILLIHSRCIGEAYKLPDAIYSSSSLKVLLIQGNILMSSRENFDWKSLTELYLENVELDQKLVDDILTGCPVLYKLELKRCFGYHRLKLKSRNLHTLAVEDSDDEHPLLLEISAPYLHFLDISFYLDGRMLNLGDIQSLCKARINFNLHGRHHGPDDEVIMGYTKELLQYINHVEELQLKRKCFEAISMVAVSGWQLPQSMRCRLEVSSSRAYRYNVSGIMALLESSPNLEMLVIEGLDTNGNYVFSDPTAKGDLDFDLSHLKTVCIRNFADPNGEPMLTLARILLKRAPVLESMEVVISGVKRTNFMRIDKKLLLFPRASNKIEVVIKQQ